MRQAELLGQDLARDEAVPEPFGVALVLRVDSAALVTVSGLAAQPYSIGRKSWASSFAAVAASSAGRRVLVAWVADQPLILDTLEE